MQKKASITVEAVLLCPLLCLILCGMLLFTLQLYRTVDAYAKEVINRDRKEMSSSTLIRLEAITEDLF